jgi:hypothetical protein
MHDIKGGGGDRAPFEIARTWNICRCIPSQRGVGGRDHPMDCRHIEQGSVGSDGLRLDNSECVWEIVAQKSAQ